MTVNDLQVRTGTPTEGIKVPLVLYDVGTVCDDLIYYFIEQHKYSLPRSWSFYHNLFNQLFYYVKWDDV